jgi:hypothetical protein
MKVMIKYLMLDIEEIEEAVLAERVAGAAVLRSAAALLDLSVEAAFDWAVDELVAQGALRRLKGKLFNV